MLETPLFFDRGSVRLFGVWHQHTGPEARLPFVFCHPMAEEKLWAHRVWVGFARELCSRGHHVLRFDCAGNGDSDLAFRQSSIETAMADIDAAVQFAKGQSGSPTVGLLGLRLGASLAYRVAARRADVESLVLWGPIVKGPRYLQELLRINLTTQTAVYGVIQEDRDDLLRTLAAGGTVNVDGYEFSKAMADQLDGLDLLKEPPAASERSLVVQIERAAAAKPFPELAALTAPLRNASVCVVQEEPFWKEIPRFYQKAPNLFECTLRWLGYD
ncbi:MAG: alpha/beta hydrolase [Vicinamibacterales bacterium]